MALKKSLENCFLNHLDREMIRAIIAKVKTT